MFVDNVENIVTMVYLLLTIQVQLILLLKERIIIECRKLVTHKKLNKI